MTKWIVMGRMLVPNGTSPDVVTSAPLTENVALDLVTTMASITEGVAIWRMARVSTVNEIQRFAARAARGE